MSDDVIAWLLDSDPAIRWQVLRDLLDAPATEVAREREKVAHQGWGARLLALQGADGQWQSDEPDFSSEEALGWWRSLPDGCRGTLFPEWTSTTWSLVLLRDLGLDPGGEQARRAVAAVRDHCRWEHDAEPYFDGEVEPCINGRTVALGAHFGIDVLPVVDRLLGEQMADGGWNCEQENGSVRGSFNSTIEVLEGLLAVERAGGATPATTGARRRGEEFLLERHLFRRLSTGAPARPEFLLLAHPSFWHYDVLRGLEYLRATGAVPDPRATEAVDAVRSRRDPSGRWARDHEYPGRMHVDLDAPVGEPSRWVTLRALRVLRWFEGAQAAG